MRVSPSRVLFGLLDIAGRVEENGAVVSAAQHTFRTRSPELFTADDVNEADAMAELCLELNRAIMAAEGGIRSCPAFAGCYNEDLGTICYFNAGHTPGLLRDASGITELKATGLPLGLFSHATCDAPWSHCLPARRFCWFHEECWKENASARSSASTGLKAVCNRRRARPRRSFVRHRDRRSAAVHAQAACPQ